MSRHLPLVQTLHPMLPGGGREEMVCAHCHEAWPCTTTGLLRGLKYYVEHAQLYSGYDEAEVRAADAAIAKAEGR